MSYRTFIFGLWGLCSLLVGAVIAPGAAPAAAQDDPSGVVNSFYRWALDYTGYDEATGEFHNPLADGSYHERPELSADFRAEVAAIRDEQGGYHYDPFTCAQDVAESFDIGQVEQIDDDHARVLVRTYFGFNPHPNAFAVSVRKVDGTWQIDGVNCQETVTARGVTEAFFNWYLEQVPAGEALDASYPYLTGDLNARIQEARRQRELGDGDPVLCAQDIPSWIAVDAVRVGQDRASMFVREYYTGNPQPHTLTVHLVHDGQWLLDDIGCDVAPETVAELLYNEYITYTRYDMARGIERTPIADWSVYPWADHMSEAFLADLLAIYRGDEFLPADPFLCAQDVPAWVTAEPILGPQSDSITVQITGAFPSGPDTFSEVPLAESRMIAPDGIWLMDGLTCAQQLSNLAVPK